MPSDQDRIDAIYAKDRQWAAELRELRRILLAGPLREELKWHQPIYTWEGANLAMPQGFRDRCVLSFFKGVLLSDPEGVLVPPGENTRSARVIEVTSVEDIRRREALILAYVDEAVALENSGATVVFEKDDLECPAELSEALEADPELRAAFDALTPGRRRGYLMHIGQAKQSATRTARVGKLRPNILAGKGFNGR